MPWHIQTSNDYGGWDTDPAPIATLEDAYLIAASETDESEELYTAAKHFGSQEAADEERVKLGAEIQAVIDRSMFEIVTS